MRPLNLDNRPCSPISSNCVIWQGPDIPCIKLCTGDTVSDVIFKLGTELCTIMDQLKVSNYDLSCLNLTACPPEDFQALIQLLINKICELNGIPADEAKASGCPDCVVSVAPCLIENGQTTMQLIDYVQLIATKLCAIISEIESINDQISVINTTLVDLQFQIDNLPTYTLPSFTVDCILSGNQPLDVIVQTLMNDNTLGYCALIGSTGTPADINAAVLSQCITDIDQPLAALPAVNTFSAYYSGSWVNAVTLGAEPTVANAINNIWIAVCDMYNYLSNLTSSTTVVAAGEGITVTSATVGSTTTYTINNIGLDYFVAQVIIGGSPISGNTAPATIPNVVNAPGKTVAKGGNNYPVGQRVQDVLQYNFMDSNGTVVNIASATYGGGTEFVGSSTPASAAPASTFLTVDNFTGVFEITKKGEYLVTMSTYLKANGDNTAYWKTTGTDGRFDIGICSGSTNSGDIFTGASKSIVANMDSNIILTAQCVIQLNVGAEVIFRMLNLTGEDYAGGAYNGSDTIRVGFVKLRDL